VCLIITQQIIPQQIRALIGLADALQPRGTANPGAQSNRAVSPSISGEQTIAMAPGRSMVCGDRWRRDHAHPRRSDAATWKALRKIRCCPLRTTAPVEAVQVLILAG
jgi:hypothetical protein